MGQLRRRLPRVGGFITIAELRTDENSMTSNIHPTVTGHQKIAGLFEQWLEEWGVQPEKEWATPA